MANNATVIGQAVEEAPEQMTMGDGVMVFQKTSQCCRCCCLQPNIHWTLHDYVENWGVSDQLPVMASMWESSPYVGRCCSYCYPGFRKTTWEVRGGASETGPVLFKHEKNWTMPSCFLLWLSDSGPVRLPCCCCLPYVETVDNQGRLLGRSQYICDGCLFVPKYDLLDKDGNRLYRVRPDTCVAGCCIKCKCCDGQKKGKCCRVPFLVRKPDPPYEPVGDAQITDLWAGAMNECCTNREMYQVKFPQDLSQKDPEAVKKSLIGMTLLVDITFNEQDE
uniref:Phospholipid scramblase n=1 Tax=Alexandrium andersonii TaxID=327968 RepID=A0A7S2F655_9DINO|mmetsp:Transcript_16444/g.37102  ORF Transcript_16444/g.37102 Transcript_16444/m.37102 type:complete len:277 (+) Transcript_16444:75-905(+)